VIHVIDAATCRARRSNMPFTTYESNITACADMDEAQNYVLETPGAQIFSSQAELNSIARSWPASRLVEIYNSFAGVKPVKKFTDRKVATARIWTALQGLVEQPAAEASTKAEAAPTARKGATTKAKATKKASPAKIAPKAAKQAKEAKPAREGSKKDIVLGLLQRAKGATLAELMEATSWQAHSVRGFISGTLGKKLGLTVNSEKREDGTRVYSIAK
jgi:hypothetical protein